MCLSVIIDFGRKISNAFDNPLAFTLLGGDFNIDGNCEPIYEILEYRLVRFGFTDMWTKFRSGEDGATYDLVDASPQRPEYLWMNPAPHQAVISVSEARLWRADTVLRAEVEQAREEGQTSRANAIVKMLDRKPHFARVTHHGAVLVEFALN